MPRKRPQVETVRVIQVPAPRRRMPWYERLLAALAIGLSAFLFYSFGASTGGWTLDVKTQAALDARIVTTRFMTSNYTCTDDGHLCTSQHPQPLPVDCRDGDRYVRPEFANANTRSTEQEYRCTTSRSGIRTWARVVSNFPDTNNPCTPGDIVIVTSKEMIAISNSPDGVGNAAQLECRAPEPGWHANENAPLWKPVAAVIGSDPTGLVIFGGDSYGDLYSSLTVGTMTTHGDFSTSAPTKRNPH